MVQRELEELSKDECFALLGQAEIGRLVYHDDIGPAAVPVNYCMAGTDIIVRVEGGAKRRAMQESVLAFEVDYIDADHHAGWSVLVRGVGRELEMDLVPQLLREIRTQFPRPWAGGVHNVWLRITPEKLTGRRLV